MKRKIRKIGNSQAVIIPASIIKQFNLKEKDKLSVKVIDNQIVLEKEDSFNPQSLEEHFVGYSGTYKWDIVFDDDKGEEVF